VSRTPVREALARLARELFLVPATNGRRTELVVAPLAEAQMQELWGLIGGLEGVAIAAVSNMGREMRRQLASAMAELNDELSTAVRRPRDVDRVSQLQSEFHICFMNVCAGPLLRRVYDTVRPHVQRYEWAYGAQARATYARSIKEHRAIIDAVGRGDGTRARALVESHWAGGVVRMASWVAFQ
jgi:DNA-binding GntR family transcriptional regulator